ncbi:protein disulfide oxidoreductase [Glycomyces halotolerans]
MKRIAIGAGLIAAVVVLGSCGSQQEPPDEAPATEEAAGEETTEAAASAPAEEAVPVPELLDFSAATVDGDDFDGAVLAGDPTVLWFWEYDCPICQSQGGTVSGLFDEHGDRIDIVGVSGAGQYAAGGDDDRRAFVDRTGTGDIVHIEDRDYELRNAFGVVSQSTFVVLDADGEIVESGSLSEGDLDEAVESLL